MDKRESIHLWGYWIIVLILLCAGCGPSATMPTPTHTLMLFPTQTPVMSPAATEKDPGTRIYDPRTRTGIEEVDHVIDVVIAGNIREIRDTLVFTITGCTHTMGLGGPPKCRGEEVEGTLVKVLPFLGPEGHHIRLQDIEEWMGVDVAGLYAVYRVSDTTFSEENYPAGEYAIVFLSSYNHTSITLQVDNGGIVRIDENIGYLPDLILEGDVEEFILPPMQ